MLGSTSSRARSCQRGIVCDPGLGTGTWCSCSNRVVFADTMSAAELEQDLVNAKEELELMAKKERESRVSL